MKRYEPRRGEWPVRQDEAGRYYLRTDVLENLKKLKSCPQCGSDTGIKIPRSDDPYCEDCGYPDEDFEEE